MLGSKPCTTITTDGLLLLNAIIQASRSAAKKLIIILIIVKHAHHYKKVDATAYVPSQHSPPAPTRKPMNWTFCKQKLSIKSIENLIEQCTSYKWVSSAKTK